MRLKLICLVLVGVLVLAVGCGSKKKSTTTTTAATTSQSTTSAGGMNLSSEDCANLAAAEQTVSNAMGGNVPNDLNTQVAKLKALAKIVPAEIKPDFEALAAAADKFAKLGIKPGVKLTPTQLQALMTQLNAAQLATAAQHLRVWAQKNCTGG
jgi:hypothetical protein